MFKCAHISDVHFRSLKRHKEYKTVFLNMFKKLKTLSPDVIFIGGDIVHSKTQGITPEIIDILNWWFTSLASIAPTHIILGNHDGLILNEDRQDAISPIISALNNENIKLYKKSGIYPTGIDGFNWAVFSCFDQKNWSKVKPVNGDVNIACFHGAVWGSKTDVDWELEGEVNLNFFSDYDFTFLGDIHKFQYLDDEKRVAYPGSTIQQNFGEDIKKGFLFWEINNRYDYTSKFISVPNPHPMVTIDWKETVENTIRFIEPIKKKAKYRIRSNVEISQSDIKLLHYYLKNDKEAAEIVYQVLTNTKNEQTIEVEKEKSLNVRNVIDRKEILASYFEDEDSETLQEIDKHFQIALDKVPEDLSSKHTKKWHIKNMSFDNTFAYGKDNFINFESLNGIVGIFGPNRCGKSSIPGTLMYGLFNTTDRGAIKNKDIVNIRKGSCKAKIQLAVDSDVYEIERVTNKRTNKKNEVSATTNLTLKNLTNDIAIDESEEQRRETEKSLRKLIGVSEDFLYTSFASQGDINAFVNEKTTARKAVLSKFLNLDIYEELYKNTREEYIVLKNKLNSLVEDNWDQKVEELNQVNHKNNNSIMTNLEKINVLREKEVQKRIELNDVQEKSKRHPSGHTLDTATDTLQFNKSKLQEIEENLDCKKEALEETKLSIEKIKKFKESFPIDDLKSDQSKLESLKTKLRDFNRELSNINAEEKRNKSQLKILDEVPCEDKFPNCKFIKNAHEAKELLSSERFIQTISDLNAHILDATNAVNKLEKENIESKIKKYNDILNKEYKLNVDLKLLNSEIESIKDKKEALLLKIKDFEELILELKEFDSNDLHLSIKKIKTEVSDISNNIVLCEKQNQQLYQDIAINSASIEKFLQTKQEYIKLKKDWEIFNKFSEAVNKKGIPTMLINSYLPKINEEINKILSGVTSFKIELSDDPKNNNLNMFIDYGDSKRVIECASGMEKMMTSIAIRVALTNISSLSRSDMFIIDEGFGALDDTNVEACGRLLTSLKKYFKTILIISHVDAIKDLVDKNIEISVKGIDSYVKVE